MMPELLFMFLSQLLALLLKVLQQDLLLELLLLLQLKQEPRTLGITHPTHTHTHAELVLLHQLGRFMKNYI